MPEGTPPADGQQGDPPDSGKTPSESKPGRTFTQEELDALVSERLRRESAKYADYEDLKAKAGQYDESQKAQQTELERAQGELKTEKERGQQIEANANAKLKRASILAEAGVQDAADPEVVVAVILASEASADIAVDKDGNVTGAKEAVKKLLKEKPFLVKGSSTPGASGGEFGGTSSKTLAEQITEAEKAGDRQRVIELKAQQMLQIKS